jgi:hypothetical protein
MPIFPRPIMAVFIIISLYLIKLKADARKRASVFFVCIKVSEL